MQVTDTSSLVTKIASLQNQKEYAELNWTGSFDDYLAVIRKNPGVTRTAFQRVYDMLLSYGQEEYIDNKKRLIRYNFFKDEHHGGRDAIYGLDIPLMRLVSVFKSAAERYGTERRVILLHGPVGSSKSTIARLLKRGLEEYSRTPEGALYTFEWALPPGLEVVPLNESELCCGAAGSYNLTQPEMAERLGERKARNILATGAEAVFTGNVGCLLQVARYLRKQRPDLWVAHPVDALWASYGGTRPGGR